MENLSITLPQKWILQVPQEQSVSINGIMYDIYTSGDVYGEEIDSPYWPYNIEDWEDDMGD